MTGAWKRLASLAVLAAAAGAHGAAAAQTPDQTAGQQGEAASNVTSYEPAFFERFRPNTARDMIGRIPGFSFDGGSGARGFSGTGGNVLIDGERPPSRGDSLSAVVSRIPASGVERIDVIRGGAEGIDMQGLPIIANIIRRADAGVSGSARGSLSFDEGGDFNHGTLLQIRNQSGGDLLEGSLEYDANQRNDDRRRWRIATDGTVLLVGEESSADEFNEIEAAGVWETNWLGGRLRVNGLGSFRTFEDESEDVLIFPGGSEFRSGKDEETEVEAGVRYTRTLDNGSQVELVGFQSLEKEEDEGVFNTPGFTSSDRDESESGESIARATVQFPPSGDWAFDGGGEAVLNFSESSGGRSRNGAPFELDGDTNRVEELRAEAFGTATWAPMENLSVESGLRYEWSRIDAMVGDAGSQKTLKYLKPRLNVSWSPADGQQLGFQIERVVDQLSFGSFASSASFDTEVFGVGNPDIEPQKLWVIDARYERQFGGQNSFVAQFVHTEIKDFLGRTVLVIPPTATEPQRFLQITRNLGTATRDALELDGTFELDRFGMEGGIFSAGLNLRDSSVADPVTGEEHSLSDENPWGWNLSLQRTLAGGDFRWSVFVEDDSDSTSWSPRSVSHGHRGPFAGASLSWKPAPGWTLDASVHNLVAEDGSFEKVFYDAPRHIGQPEYTEFSTNEARRRLSLSLRRDF